MNTPCSSSISERILSFADMWDVDHPGPLAMHKIILVHPGRSAGPTFPTVSWSDEGTIMTSLNPLLQENLLYPQYCYHTRRLDGTVARHITETH